MPTVLDIFVRGIPKGQPRARHAGMAMVCVWRNGAKKWTTKFQQGDVLVLSEKPKVINHVFNPDVADEWKRRVRDAVQAAWSVYTPDPITGHKGAGKLKEPLDEPLICDITLYFPRPQYMLDSAFKYGKEAIPYDVKPDRDNADKAVLDAMTDAGIWVDDCRVYAGEISKWYSRIGGAAGARIEVETERKTEATLFEAAEKKGTV